jgi:renalase
MHRATTARETVVHSKDREVPTVPVVVVGAGVSGVACARELAAAGIPVELRERDHVLGGRMASRTLAGRPVDLGASYLTCRSPEFAAVVGSWSERGLVRPWTDRFAVRTAAGWGESELGPVRYGTPGGLRSLVEDLAAGLDVRFRREVAAVGPGPTVDGDPAAAVVLAMPDARASDLLAAELTEELAAVDGRPSEPAFAIAAGWAERCWPDLDGAFVADDPDLTWIADDGRRRGDGAAVLVGHTTASFAVRHRDRPPDAAAPTLAALRRLLDIDRPPVWSYLQRWPLARPVEPHDAPYHLGGSMVGLCGDAWGSPRVETAWTSGHRLGRALVERLA